MTTALGLFAMFFIFGFFIHQGLQKNLQIKVSDRVNSEADTGNSNSDDSRENARTKSLQDVVETFREESQGKNKSKNEISKNFQNQDLRILKGRDLYVLLEEKDFIQLFDIKMFNQVKSRFDDPLPPLTKDHVSLREQELAMRLALLRGLSKVSPKNFKTNEIKDVITFYWQILENKNQDWVFQRQAYINLRRHQLIRDENHLREIRARVKPEIVALAQVDEKDLLEAYIGN